ncbi:uncharacterized protein LOC134506816 [Candoia aspera]|uniref:uncharacterized protein LOC134506816 n=1 Tax=Candoia aspera TaxID=51853 RepID=UPI002FD86849
MALHEGFEPLSMCKALPPRQETAFPLQRGGAPQVAIDSPLGQSEEPLGYVNRRVSQEYLRLHSRGRGVARHATLDWRSDYPMAGEERSGKARADVSLEQLSLQASDALLGRPGTPAAPSKPRSSGIEEAGRRLIGSFTLMDRLQSQTRAGWVRAGEEIAPKGRRARTGEGARGGRTAHGRAPSRDVNSRVLLAFIFRSAGEGRGGLPGGALLPRDPQQQPREALLSPSEKSKDWSVPNPSWSQEMIRQFNRYVEMTKDGSWQKLPSYRNFCEHSAEGHQKHELRKLGNRLFLRSIDEEGMGFEYAMFLNPLEKRIVCVLQVGPYLEGPSGFAHGGSIATILDSTLGGCALCFNPKVVTANLSINYKSPIALCSVVLVEGRLEKTEGRKVFVSGEVRSVDGQTVHADATALFIQLQPSFSPQEKAESK